MRACVRGSIVLVLAVAACEVPLQEVSPIDQAVTAWQPIAAPGGDRLAFVLEPRLVHRIEHGVIVEGYTTTVVGPSLVVDADGTLLTTLATGVTTVVHATMHAWALQQDLDHWDHQPPNERAPRTPYVRATVFDRATFSASPVVDLSPPIDVPVAVGDDLLDVPSPGTSDIPRDMFVRLREIDGTTTVIHAGRGFGSAWCAGGTTVVLAYQAEAPTTDVRVVTVRRVADAYEATELVFVDARLDPSDLACDATAEHVALGAVIDQVPHVFVLDATSQLAVDAMGLEPPLALRTDGTAAAAVRVSDRAIVLADDAGVTAVGLTSATAPRRAIVVGDLALFDLDAGRRPLDLATGVAGPELDSFSSGESITLTAWPDGEAFVVLGELLHYGTSPDELQRLLIVDAGGEVGLPLPPVIGDPHLTKTFGAHVYLSAHAETDYRLFGYDLATMALTSDGELPLCDEALVLGAVGCR
jgi:hypothetical protein